MTDLSLAARAALLLIIEGHENAGTSSEASTFQDARRITLGRRWASHGDLGRWLARIAADREEGEFASFFSVVSSQDGLDLTRRIWSEARGSQLKP